MAITDAGKWGESSSLTNPLQYTIGGTGDIKAGSLVLVYFGGRSPNGNNLLGMSSVSDSAHNKWNIKQFQSGYRATGIAWTRTSVPLQNGTDWIKFQWNRKPSSAWISIHAFEGADSVAFDTRSANGSSKTFNSKLDTPSGDWLLVQSLVIPYEDSLSTTLTGSTVRQDTNSNVPFLEGLSLAGNGAGQSTIGSSLSSMKTYGLIALCFGAKAMPASGSSILSGVIGV